MRKDSVWNNGDSRLSRFSVGADFKACAFFGVHPVKRGGTVRTVCRVWAPNARSVSIVGEFNGWKPGENPLKLIGGGIWECFLPFCLRQYDPYKFCVEKKRGGKLFKNDPYAFYFDDGDGNGSKFCAIGGFPWNDAAWMRRRAAARREGRPVNIYEVRPDLWRRGADGMPLSYTGLAEQLIPYLKDLGYTHVELAAVAESSGGCGAAGFFAPSSRCGTPEELMAFIEKCHEEDIGVILGWTPARFPEDASGLARFDGTPCYEYADPSGSVRKGTGELAFDFGKGEVASFLISSAVFWLEQYHADGLRVRGVASMLFSGNRNGENGLSDRNGANVNLEAVTFLQRLNGAIGERFPGAMSIAGDAGTWPMVSRPAGFGGLGFTARWNTVWTDRVLRYLSLEPQYRKFNHDTITFSLFHAFTENDILPLSHDRMAGDGPAFPDQMPGENRWKLAGIRALLTFMAAHPGKKLVAMGTELGAPDAWTRAKPAPFSVGAAHGELRDFCRALNRFYRDTPALWELDDSREGFAWIANGDCAHSILAFRRIGKNGAEVIAVCNFLPELREDYRVGVPYRGVYAEIFSSDRKEYGGSGVTNGTGIVSDDDDRDGFRSSIRLTLPPLSVLFLRCRRRSARRNAEPAGRL